MNDYLQRMIFIVVALLTWETIEAQEYPVNMYYNVKKSYCGWKSNSKVHIVKVLHDTDIPEYSNSDKPVEQYFLFEEGSETPHEVITRFDGAMECDYKTPADVWNHYVIGTVLNMIQKKGFQTELRNELEDDAIDFVYRLQNDGREFKDPYLENYIYSLVTKIAPITLVDSRPGNANIVILDDDEQNAGTFSNGTICINTGLLATLHTEDELVAILAHEIAHFVLDHQVANITDAIKRQKRAEFWAQVATGLTAVAEGVAATQNPYYKPGNATKAVSQISASIADEYLKRSGMKYNHNQEDEADECAKEILKVLGYDSNALATALTRIRESYEQERDNSYYYSSYTHPALNKRIWSLGKPYNRKDSQFEKMVSFAVSCTAKKKFESRRYRQALALINQNVDNNVATTDDYIIRASCLLALKNDQPSNQEALNSINKAKTLCRNDFNLYRPEIIALLRLGNKSEAINELKLYQQRIYEEFTSLKNIVSDDVWSWNRNYLSTESEWVSNMLTKLNGM